MRRMPSWSQKTEATNFPADFCTRILLGVSRYAATWIDCCFVSGSYWYNQFRPRSPIATGNNLDRAKKIPKLAQATGTVDVFDPRSGISGPTSRRASACPNLHEWWTQPVTWDVQLHSYWFSRSPAVFQDYLVNLINNLRGGHCFGSSRTRRITGGKITTFKLGHPIFDGGIWWCIFP